MTSLPTSSSLYGFSSRLTVGLSDVAMGELSTSKNLRKMDSSSRFGLDLQKGAIYWRKFLNVTSSETSLQSIEDMLRRIFSALSAFSGLCIIEAFRSLPFGLNPPLLIERRSTKTVSGVKPHEPPLVMWMSPER